MLFDEMCTSCVVCSMKCACPVPFVKKNTYELQQWHTVHSVWVFMASHSTSTSGMIKTFILVQWGKKHINFEFMADSRFVAVSTKVTSVNSQQKHN